MPRIPERGDNPAIPLQFIGLQILPAGTTTYRRSRGARYIVVHCVGAGGGGGGGVTGATATSAGSGGESGGYAMKTIHDPVEEYATSIPTGGLGAAAGNNPGTGAAVTSFGNPILCQAKGGAGGGAGGVAGTSVLVVTSGVDGNSLVGDHVVGPSAGGPSVRLSATIAVSGTGGAGVGPFGGAGAPGRNTQGAGSNSGGITGGGYGGGGAGGLSLNGGASVAGGNGGDGVIIVEEYQ